MNYDNEFRLVDPRDNTMELHIVPDASGDSAHIHMADLADGYLHLAVEELVELRDWLNDFIGDAAEVAWNPDEVARDAFLAVVNPNTCTSEDDTNGSEGA